MLLQPSRPDGVQDPERSQTVDVTGVLCHLERDLDVRLSAEIVDFGRHDLSDDVDEVSGVRQVTVVKDHFGLVVWWDKDERKKGGEGRREVMRGLGWER
jgi:hypothetical protein